MSLWKWVTTKKPEPTPPATLAKQETGPRDEKVYVEITAADRLDFVQRTGRILDDDEIDALLLRDEAWLRPRLVDTLVGLATTRMLSYGSYAVPDTLRITQLRDLLLYGKLPPRDKKARP